MNIAVVTILTLMGLVIGAALAWLIARSKTAAMAERKSELELELNSVKTQLAQQRADNSTLLADQARVEATLVSERKNAEEKLSLLTNAGEQLKAQFQVLASAALESSNARFLQLATATLQNYQTQAAGDLAQKEQAVKNLVDPIAQSLDSMNKQIQALEQARSQAYGTLTNQVVSLTETQRALHNETGNLVKALREPQTRGRWGELQLRKVLELAGMLEYCDFEEQVSVALGDRRLRPDVVVRLPGAKNIVIDAKAPLAGYLNALEAPDEATRTSFLMDHARQIRQHIDSLGAKAYWAQFQPTPEFVLLFLPGEVFFRAALMADPELLEYGDGKVILTSPITMIAVLKTIAYGWSQKNLAENARNISEAGKLLYERLCTMTGYVDSLGKKLRGAVESYNEMLGSMEKRVFPAGRKVVLEHDRLLTAESLPDPKQIENTPRHLESPDWRDGALPESFSLVSEDADPSKS
ncbi:MAG TPA: DNA recombination protein RmuC [Terriglobales bacterium]|jgi:DNA recombination protein RmuC